MADGRLNKCKACTRADVKTHRAENLEQVRAYDRERSRTPERKAQFMAKQRRKRSDPVYMAAHNAVARAVRSGELKRPEHCERCECTEVEAHHDNHAKPLDVMWLCPVHHAERHKEIGKLRTVN